MTVTLSELLMGIVILPFLWVALDGVLGALRRVGEMRRQSLSVRRCHLCGKNYPEGKGVKISTCPECGGLNHRRGHRKLG